MQTPLRVARPRLVERPDKDFLHFVVHCRSTSQHQRDISSRDLGKQRNGLIAQAVPYRHRLAIAGILAPAEAPCRQPGTQIAPPESKQRAKKLQGGAGFGDDALRDAHAPEPVRSAQQIPQHGFRLIVGMMSENDPRAAVLARTNRKKLMARPPRGGFQRFAALLSETSHLHPLSFKGQPERYRQLPHKAPVLGRSPPSQAMVQVANHQSAQATLHEQMQQRHRISTARHAHQPAAAG